MGNSRGRLGIHRYYIVTAEINYSLRIIRLKYNGVFHLNIQVFLVKIQFKNYLYSLRIKIKFQLRHILHYVPVLVESIGPITIL